MSTILEKPVLSPQGTRSNAERRAQPVARFDAATAGLLVASLILLAIAGRGAISHWWSEYNQPESYYAFAPAVPFIMALMFWHRREAIRASRIAPCYWAAAALLPALTLLVISTKQDMPAVETIAFIVSLWSSVWLIAGSAFLRAAFVPLGFIVFMAPLPGPILNDGTFALQQMSISGAVHALHLLTYQPALSGNVITLDNYSVFVDVPCSGFHLLLAMLTCSAALAFLLDGSAAKRGLLFLIGIPLSLAVNVARLTLLCIVGDSFGGHAAAIFHDWDGLFTVALGSVTLLAIARWMGCRTFAGQPLFLH